MIDYVKHRMIICKSVSWPWVCVRRWSRVVSGSPDATPALAASPVRLDAAVGVRLPGAHRFLRAGRTDGVTAVPRAAPDLACGLERRDHAAGGHEGGFGRAGWRGPATR